ncbi:MAG TPA: DUF2125 domain-containing protein [Rhizomicrobium sp.]|nr:DUF2125 domain-containing protein [Rhizomicrobium sp.]
MFKYSSRFWLYAPITLFLILAIAVMVHWWMAAGAFEKRLAGLKGRQVVPGITLDWKAVRIGGFPFRLDADFTNFTIKGAGAHGPFAWASDKFALHALTYGRIQDVYEAAGQQQLNWTGADGGSHAASFLPGSMRGSSILDAQGLRRFDLDIVDMGGQGFTIGRLQLHMRRDPDGSDLDLMLKADAVNAHKQVQVYALLSPAGSLAALLKGEASWPQAAADWRAQGGKAKLSQVVAPGLAADALLAPLY